MSDYEKKKKSIKKYFDSEKGRAAKRRADRKYNNSKKGKARIARYRRKMKQLALEKQAKFYKMDMNYNITGFRV